MLTFLPTQGLATPSYATRLRKLRATFACPLLKPCLHQSIDTFRRDKTSIGLSVLPPKYAYCPLVSAVNKTRAWPLQKGREPAATRRTAHDIHTEHSLVAEKESVETLTDTGSHIVCKQRVNSSLRVSPRHPWTKKVRGCHCFVFPCPMPWSIEISSPLSTQQKHLNIVRRSRYWLSALCYNRLVRNATDITLMPDFMTRSGRGYVVRAMLVGRRQTNQPAAAIGSEKAPKIILR